MRYFLVILVALMACSQTYAQIISNKKGGSTTTTTPPPTTTPATGRPAATPVQTTTRPTASTPATATAPKSTAVACLAGEITIGGVTWAGSNISGRQMFSPRPDSLGMLYQFNNATPYTSSDPLRPEWKTDAAAAGDWQMVLDPCPQGWRLPTNVELQALANAGSAWYTGYAVPGRFYGANASSANRIDNKGCVFLPAAGLRSEETGWLFNQKLYGYYWSNKQYDGNSMYLFLYNNGSAMSSGGKHFAYSVRCVKR